MCVQNKAGQRRATLLVDFKRNGKETVQQSLSFTL